MTLTLALIRWSILKRAFFGFNLTNAEKQKAISGLILTKTE